jgi:protein TonB
VSEKTNSITLHIEKKIVSKRVGEVTKNKKANNIEKSPGRQVTKKSVSERNKNVSKSKKKVKELSNIKSPDLIQINKSEMFNKNKADRKINIDEKEYNKDIENSKVSIGKSEGELDSITGSVNENTLISDYIDYIYKTLKENIYYPKLALRRNLEGTVYVEFIITIKGEVKNIKIAKSSGYKVLDEAGIKIAEKCSPLKVPAKEMKINAPIVFKLRN